MVPKSPCFPHIPATAHARWLKPRATCDEATLRRLAEAAQAAFVTVAGDFSPPVAAAPAAPIEAPGAALRCPARMATAHARWLKPRATCDEADLRRLDEAAQAAFVTAAGDFSPPAAAAPAAPIEAPEAALRCPARLATAHARWLKPRATCCEADLRRLAEAAQGFLLRSA